MTRKPASNPTEARAMLKEVFGKGGWWPLMELAFMDPETFVERVRRDDSPQEPLTRSPYDNVNSG